MRCLFCKNDSTNSKSVEHIVPESLGNKTLTLPLGYVCDTCNNYFARKVEKPFMEIPDIKQMRFQLDVPNKKNKIPKINGLLDNGVHMKISKKLVNNELVYIMEVEPEDIQKIFFNNPAVFFTPAFTNETEIKDDKTISRFIAKIALEALADRLKPIEKSLDDIIDDNSYEDIRNHARYGKIDNWPCSIRRIYDYNKEWKDNDESIQKVFEYDFLLIPFDKNIDILKINEPFLAELYFIIIIWGMEFTINMAGPEIDGYIKWLKENNNISPLYQD